MSKSVDGSWVTRKTKGGWVSYCKIGNCSFKTDPRLYSASAEVWLNVHRQETRHDKQGVSA